MEANYYLVVDLESTCDDAGAVPRAESEVIEIGAVLVDGRTLERVDDFATFVRPVRHPTLTTFCKRLTTITQAQVDDAPGFAEAAAAVAAFGQDALFCSWGNYDRNKLAEDAAFHGVAMPLGPAHWNLKVAFSKRRLGMSEALRLAGLALVGTHHRGIDDARNIARLLPYILKRGAAWRSKQFGATKASKP